MDLEEKLFALVFLFLFPACILFVVFGQVTVRKLRKNPATKHHLGADLASGWDILNVAGAFSRPKWLSKRLRNSPLFFFAADEAILYANTNKFDRLLGRVFFALYMAGGSLGIALVILNSIGIFD